MADFSLTLFEHRLSGNEPLALPSGNRVLYVVDGADAAVGLAANAAWCGAAEVTIDSAAGATVLRFELARGEACGGGREVLMAPVALDPGEKYLMRADRVDFPIGGVAYLHRHQGPGIRRLLHG